jgi:hypothetical protein
MKATQTIRKMGLILLSLSLGLLAGCATNAPSSAPPAAGSISVGDFRYLPHESGALAANQVKSNTAGKYDIDKDVKDYVRDDVVDALRSAGIKLNDPNRALGGDIQLFLVDYVGSNIDLTFKVRYQVKDLGKNKVLFESEKIVKRTVGNSMSPYIAADETIKLSVDKLLEDPQFIKVIQ